MKEGKCLGLVEIKGVELVLEQPEGDEVRTEQKALLPTSRGDLHAYLCPRHKSGQPIVMWGFPGALGADFPRSDGAAVMKSASSIAAVLPAYL